MSDTGFQHIGPLRAHLHPKTDTPKLDATGNIQPAIPRKPRFPLRAEPTWADGIVRSADGTQPIERPVSGGWGDASGSGHPDGNPVRTARGRGDIDGPCFDIDVPPNGYAWWYIDGISHCGTRAISIIGFIGSVFSPWYRWSGRKSPRNHCCINVATYGPGGRFTMTDRGESALRTSQNVFEVGPSKMTWTGRQTGDRYQ
jgi:hypothetical protein